MRATRSPPAPAAPTAPLAFPIPQRAELKENNTLLPCIRAAREGAVAVEVQDMHRALGVAQPLLERCECGRAQQLDRDPALGHLRLHLVEQLLGDRALVDEAGIVGTGCDQQHPQRQCESGPLGPNLVIRLRDSRDSLSLIGANVSGEG
jgi:hypothetical protein